MLLSRDFRKIARENLRGRWFPAIVVGFLGGLLGAVMDVSYSTEIFTQTGTSNTDALDQLKSAGVYDAILPVSHGTWDYVDRQWYLIQLVIGGAVTLGYAQYFLNVTDDNDPSVGNLFSHIRRLWEGFCMQFFRGMMVMLWSHPVCDSRIYCFVSICYDTLYYGRKRRFVSDGSDYRIQADHDGK